jgi:hypothetical protein
MLRGHMAMKWASFAQFGEDYGNFSYWKNRAKMDLFHGTSEGASGYGVCYLLRYRGMLRINHSTLTCNVARLRLLQKFLYKIQMRIQNKGSIFRRL